MSEPNPDASELDKEIIKDELTNDSPQVAETEPPETSELAKEAHEESDEIIVEIPRYAFKGRVQPPTASAKPKPKPTGSKRSAEAPEDPPEGEL